MEAKYVSKEVIRNHIQSNGIAILPVGACEQHGYHLPLGTDSILAENISKEISVKTGAAIFPTLEFGYSWVWKELPGTITYSQQLYRDVLLESVQSLIRMGYKKILIVNGHDSNKMAIKYAIRELSEFSNAKILNIFYPGLMEFYEEVFESETWFGMFHADEFETSLMLHFKEELVNMGLARKEYPERPSLYGYDESSLSFISKSGVYGDATVATKEKGEKIASLVIDRIQDLIRAM